MCERLAIRDIHGIDEVLCDIAHVIVHCSNHNDGISHSDYQSIFASQRTADQAVFGLPPQVLPKSARQGL